jgi:hypothetical protein
MPRQPRTLYFNDARHYSLFAFEPPMRLEDAWRPIDEVAGALRRFMVLAPSSQSSLPQAVHHVAAA